MATVFVVAPSSTDAQIAETVEAGMGFVYASALMGVANASQAAHVAGSAERFTAQLAAGVRAG